MQFIFPRSSMSEPNVLQSKQVTPLPIGPGGKSALANQMNDTNTKLTLLASQATANTLYDPPVPKPATKQVIQGFCSPDQWNPATWVAGVACVVILYGIISE
jgi:hypothetical protein